MTLRSLAFDMALQDLATLLHRIALVQSVPAAITEDDLERERLLQLAQQFSAEELQLFYQIAIHGRNEIDLAPDEYAGFTMTLLRMLAFMPTGAQPVPERAMPVTPTSAPLPARPQAAPAPQLGPEAASRAAASTATVYTGPLDWSALLAQLNVQGMVRELAKNCVLESYAVGKMALSLTALHKHLLSHKEKLQAALGEYFAQPLRLTINMGEASAATPAAVEQGVKQARQQEAEAAILQDPFVREAQAKLGAQLMEDTTRPIK